MDASQEAIVVYSIHMDQTPVTCNWVFDAEEYKTTQVLARRLDPIPARLLMFLCIPMLGFAGMLAPNAHEDFKDPSFFIPIIVLIVLTIYVVTQHLPIRALVSTRSFRRSELYNLRLNQTVSQEGYLSEDASARALVKWSGLTHAVETPQGFALFRPGKKRVFLWIPMHGFSSPDDISLCRNLIRENLTDFRSLKS